MKRLLFIGLFLLSVQTLLAQTEVVFSRQGGFYEESFALELACADGYHIRYTLNGSTPTADAALYTESLFLDSTLYSQSNIYKILDCLPSAFYMAEEIKKAIVIRAAAFDDNDNRVGDVSTHTYLIRSLGCDLHGLPVLSIAADSLDLFGFERGILVPGAHFDAADSTATGNYFMKGREWERPINVEFYETDNSGINQNCGLRTHGAKSRRYQQKGMRLYAREEYGKKRFKHRFFEESPLASFKHLNLRPFRCSHWWQTGGQDYLSQRVAAQMDVDGMNVRQIVVFINGEYWGIYTLEESPDERYLEDHYDVDLEEVNILKYWGVTSYGDGSDWSQFRSWMESADLNRAEDSAYAFSRMDVPSFMDYYLLEVYGANLDWPQNNVLQWQASHGEPFRMMFYDGDGCFTHWYFPAMDHAVNVGTSSLIIRKFMESESFKSLLYERYSELKSGVFAYGNLKEILECYRGLVADEVLSQSRRFGFPENEQRWQADMDSVDAFFANRTEAFYKEMQKAFASVPFTLNEMDAYPNPNNGTFKVHVASDASFLVPVRLFDATGRLVHAEDVFLKPGSNTIEIDGAKRAGLYLMKFGDVVKRIIIQ